MEKHVNLEYYAKMAENPENIILHHLQAIREELALTNKKIGTLADGQVGMRHDIQSLKRDIQNLKTEMNDLKMEVHALRADLQTLAIAFDGHSERLDRIEHRLGLMDSTH
jgi:chromosome segregation ATPase